MRTDLLPSLPRSLRIHSVGELFKTDMPTETVALIKRFSMGDMLRFEGCLITKQMIIQLQAQIANQISRIAAHYKLVLDIKPIVEKNDNGYTVKYETFKWSHEPEPQNNFCPICDAPTPQGICFICNQSP